MASGNDRNIAVIGAGAAGLCVAKYLAMAGIQVTIFEIGTQIGGLWCFMNDNLRSSAYSTLHINTSRSVTRFHDLDFDEGVQSFPDHKDMHEYLVKYAEHFDLVKLIRFQSRVVDVRPQFPSAAKEPYAWEIELDSGKCEIFDAVVIASGHLTRPLHVAMYKNDFSGHYLHGHDYKAPEPFVGKRVCVVGVGNSACDMATDICSTSRRCVLVARSGVLILPKLFCGIPFTDITRRIQRSWVPAWLRRRLIAWLAYLIHGSMTKVGFKPLGQRAHVTSNGTIITDIVYNRIEVKQGILKIDGQTLYFDDGTHEEFDVILAATGYLIDLPFISSEIIPLENNKLDLYKRIVQPDWPGLYLMGFFNTDTALNMVYEYQARWIRDIETGIAKLPESDAMYADIQAKNQWVESNYKESARHTIEEEHVPYIAELKKSNRQMRRAVK